MHPVVCVKLRVPLLAFLLLVHTPSTVQHGVPVQNDAECKRHQRQHQDPYAPISRVLLLPSVLSACSGSHHNITQCSGAMVWESSLRLRPSSSSSIPAVPGGNPEFAAFSPTLS
ncbi:Hypothetical predicted protein [Podarcis lilfordi]|uniref:Secreted protein n=1 Tax=Podarcis lilfordi TaxID=74358 RepID=A0AA35KE50_9SAUR|nr:Hypothetical predicted protein [Podarcis lilfordi]